jgi:plasmid stabilization system protein ParE
VNDRSSGSDRPSSFALRLHERAFRDINAAHARFAALVSPEIADEWRDGLREAIASLAAKPRRCPLAPERFRREVRQLLYRRPGSRTAYRILFTLSGQEPDSPDAPTVTVLHVRHASARPISRAQAREIESGK